MRRLGELAGLPGGAVAERLGPDGRRAWSLARGGERRRVRGRRPPSELVERLEFPEAVGNELTLRRAFNVLLDRLLSRPEREQRFARKVAIAARVVGGASWRRTITLRDPTIERDRLRAALAPKLAELPAPVIGAAARARRAHRVDGSAARAGAGRRRGARHTSQREPASGAREHRLGLGEHRRGGGAVVADTGSARAVRSAGRLNVPAARRSSRRTRVRRAAAREPAVGRARARGVARRRPLVDGGAGRAALLRARARLGPERSRLPRRGARVLVHAARLDHAANVERPVLDRADLEHVTAARDEVADIPRALLAAEGRRAARRSRRRARYAKRPLHRPLHRLPPYPPFRLMGYVELHAHSAYSFLDGASLPEELAVRAAELGYEALALTDHDGALRLARVRAGGKGVRRARRSRARR